MSVAMLIVGTMIGAGFASGKEVVAFFGAKPNMFSALIMGVLVFGCSVLFLFVGRRVKKTDIGEVNGAVFGKARPFADVFMLFNSTTVLGAMLAATDSLAAEFIDIRPLASIVVGLLCAVIAIKGLNGVIKANAVLVPLMIAFLCVCSIVAIDFPFRPQSAPIRPYSIILYVSMMLIALKSGKPMYFVCLPIIGASVFTTMLSAFKSLFDYLSGFFKHKIIAAGIVLIGGLAVGAFSFTTVVSNMYPIVGGIGLAYIAWSGWYLFRTRVKRKIKTKAKRIKRKIKAKASVNT